MDFLIPQDLAQAVLDYLAGQPYRQVAALVDGLQKMEKVPEPSAEPPAPAVAGDTLA